MDAKVFRVNYKSDFILTLTSDAGWMTPFCIKFWTGSPMLAYYASYDGETYTHCTYDPSEPTKLTVQFDDHHLPIGNLKYQVAYHFTVADFPENTEDEVTNQANVTTEIDGDTYQVMLDLNGETAPEIQFALPAYANELQRIQNEQTRIAQEQQRVNQEQTRINQEAARVTEFNGIKAEALADHQRANEDHSRAQTDHQNAIADRSQAASDHSRAVSDHNTADSDHSQANSDHSRAQSDHNTAISDHQTALSDHSQANSDHTRAESDHTRATADSSTAANDHRTASTDHTQANTDHARAESDHQRVETDLAEVEQFSNSLGAYDISAAHATGSTLATYPDLATALGSNGSNIPEALRKGGMSVKFVLTSDNKYAQCRYIGTSTANVNFTNVANWQGVDDELTDDSNNLAKSGGVKKYVDTNIQTLPLLVSKYSIQVTTWAYSSSDDYKHLVIPVIAGDKITFNSTIQVTMPYALLASYITPVLGATPDFVTGYEGRQTITKSQTLTIPAGTHYLIINNPHLIGLSELYVNGVSVFDGIWGVLHKFGGNITPEDLSFSLEQFEKVSNKTDEIVRSSDKDKFISQYGVNNNIEPIKAGLKGQKLYNLFTIKYRNYVTNAGVVPESDIPASSHNCSDYIPVTFGNKYFYVLGGSSSISIISEFDSTKQLISNIVGTGVRISNTYTPSSNNVAYVVLSSNVEVAPDYCFVDITNRLYAFKEEVPEVDIQIGIVSKNIANPANVWDKTMITSVGKALTKDEYTNYKVAYIEVSPGDVITVGGNDDGRTTYYALFDVMPTQSSTSSGATTPVDYGNITQQELIDGKTITVPNNCHYLFWQLQFNGSPSSENVKIQANRGNALLPYDVYQEAITSINRIPLASAVPSDLEERVEQLESDVEDLQGQVLSSLIADLPVSADGSGIDVGYAYINSSTGVVTVKLS